MLRLIAFDLGKNMAWAHRGLDGQVLSNHEVFKGDRCTRAGATYVWLRDLLELFKDDLDCVVYERPFARGYDATRSLWGLAGLIEGLSNAAGLPSLDITPSEIKQWATGSGAVKKDPMLDAARRLGYTKDNEHEADAYCLLCFQEATLTMGAAPPPLVPRKSKRDQTKKDLPK